MFCTNLVSGVVVFFALVGLLGLLSHCFSFDYRDDDPSCLPEPECSYGCLDCETTRSGDDDDCVCVVIMVVVLVFALLGIFYGFIAATMAFQKIMQRHYHILKKKELTKARTSILLSTLYPFKFCWFVHLFNNQSKLKTLSVSRCTWWRILKGVTRCHPRWTQSTSSAWRCCSSCSCCHYTLACISYQRI